VSVPAAKVIVPVVAFDWPTPPGLTMAVPALIEIAVVVAVTALPRVAPPLTVHEPPRVHVTLLIVIDGFAMPAFVTAPAISNFSMPPDGFDGVAVSPIEFTVLVT
jgi:hypothetical protein